MDGRLEEAPGARVRPDQVVTVAPDASLLALTPVTLLLHKPVGFEAGLGLPQALPPTAAAARARAGHHAAGAASHLPEDASGIRVLQRHSKAAGMFHTVAHRGQRPGGLPQDKRIARKLAEDIESLEQECIVEVAGEIAPNGLQRLCHGLSFNGPLPPSR